MFCPHLLDLRVGRIDLDHAVADVDRVDEPLGLQVVEGQLEADRRAALALVLPGVLVRVGRVGVRLRGRRGGGQLSVETGGGGQAAERAGERTCSFSITRPRYSQALPQDWLWVRQRLHRSWAKSYLPECT